MSQNLHANFSEKIPELSAVIWKGIEQTSPHAGAIGGNTLFNGSYDWHSCVHAHWALLSIARTTKNSELEKKLSSRIEASKLEEEFNYLQKNMEFEMPYGRVWFLLFLKELSLRSGWEQANQYRKTIELQISNWLDQHPFPDGNSSQRFIATHQSWAFALLFLTLSDPVNEEVKLKLKNFEQRLLKEKDNFIKNQITDRDFLFIPAVFALYQQKTLGDYAYKIDDLYEIPTNITQANAHTPGAYVVRLWPHARQCALHSESPSCKLYDDRMQKLFKREDAWSKGFETVSHWVPQFMWMAYILRSGSLP